jgi:hypothetical protein
MTNRDKQKARCELMVEALVGKEMAPKWWASPNKAFKDQTPFVAFELNSDEVHDYLAWHCYGGFA